MKVIEGADEGGLGLPDRDYYLKDDAKMKELRALYQSHVVEMLKLAGTGEGDAQKQAKTVMAIETALARGAMDKVERREPNKVYHRTERAGVKKAAAHYLWHTYSTDGGAAAVPA